MKKFSRGDSVVKKRMIRIYLAALMLLSLVPMTTFASGTSAWEAPTVQAYAEKADLSVFNLHASSESDHNYKKVQFGAYDGKPVNWYIADGNTGTLLAYEIQGIEDSVYQPFGLIEFYYPMGSHDYTDGEYTDAAGTPELVYSNHYGGSYIRYFLNNNLLGCFTSQEQALMAATTVKVEDYRNPNAEDTTPSHYTVTDKLYLGTVPSDTSGDAEIYLGPDGSVKVPVGEDSEHPYGTPYGTLVQNFWLASPLPSEGSFALAAQPGVSVGSNGTSTNTVGICPAFCLDLNNLKSGSFFSAAPAGISGAKEIRATAPAGSGGNPDFSAEDPFIMRLPDDGTFADANITFDATVVRAEGAKKDATLVVQWSEDGKDYCYGKAIAEGASDEVTASDIATAAGCASAVLPEDCKVWLEYTDTASHITYAKLGHANFGKSLTTATVSAGKSPVYNGGVPVDPKDFGITVTLNDGTEVPDDGFELRFYLDENCTSAILDAGKPCAPTDAGIYFVTAVGIEDEGYRGETETPAMVYVLKAALPKPVAVSGITYNGQEQTGVRLPDGADASRYIISGDKATEVGAYMANLALADPLDYCWAGESGDPRDDTISKPFTLNWEIKATAAELTKIIITKAPDKTTYTVGEVFDTTGMEVTAFYSDGSSKPVTGYTVKPSGALTAADTVVIITYTENGITKTESQKIQVNDGPELWAIIITKAPDKTTYTVGEVVDTTGMEVQAVYSDGSSKPVTGYTVNPFGALTAADTVVKITYTENGITKTASQIIQVNDRPELINIKITTAPDKTTYTVGDVFDTTGMEVTAVYSDGSSKPVTGYTVTPSGALTVADTVVKIGFKGNFSTEFVDQKIQVNDGPKYEIIKGKEQPVFINANSAVFASSAPFDKFSHVLLDGKKLAKEYYTAESGSTVITLNENCIRKLSVGKHTLTIVSTDGIATAKFNVKKAMPKTGDSTNPALLLAIMIVCTGMTVLLSGKAKKRNS